MNPIPKNNAQEFFKTLFIKSFVTIRHVILNQVLIVTDLGFSEFKKGVYCNGQDYNNTALESFYARLLFNN